MVPVFVLTFLGTEHLVMCACNLEFSAALSAAFCHCASSSERVGLFFLAYDVLIFIAAPHNASVDRSFFH
jgi:hypothetical protein